MFFSFHFYIIGSGKAYHVCTNDSSDTNIKKLGRHSFDKYGDQCISVFVVVLNWGEAGKACGVWCSRAGTPHFICGMGPLPPFLYNHARMTCGPDASSAWLLNYHPSTVCHVTIKSHKMKCCFLLILHIESEYCRSNQYKSIKSLKE